MNETTKKKGGISNEIVGVKYQNNLQVQLLNLHIETWMFAHQKRIGDR
jgi:hypothetical protein